MFEEADLVSSYSRAQALADGELVDVSTIAREAGFTLPVAVTRAVWVDCIQWGADEKEAKPQACQDQEGRLWDVVYMANRSARQNPRASRSSFCVYRVPTDGRGLKARPVMLILRVTPGDQGEPVLTICQPLED